MKLYRWEHKMFLTIEMWKDRFLRKRSGPEEHYLRHIVEVCVSEVFGSRAYLTSSGIRYYGGIEKTSFSDRKREADEAIPPALWRQVHVGGHFAHESVVPDEMNKLLDMPKYHALIKMVVPKGASEWQVERVKLDLSRMPGQEDLLSRQSYVFYFNPMFRHTEKMFSNRSFDGVSLAEVTVTSEMRSLSRLLVERAPNPDRC